MVGSFIACRPSADAEDALNRHGIVMPVESAASHPSVLLRTPVALHERTAPLLRSGFRPQVAVTRQTCRWVRSTRCEQEASMVPGRRQRSTKTGVSPGLVEEYLDRIVDERETDLERRLAALEAREAAFADRMRTAEEILAAADQRDADADQRDRIADRREHDLDLAEFVVADGEYGNNWPERRASALDRKQAKEDRLAARRDRMALAQDRIEPGGLQPSD